MAFNTFLTYSFAKAANIFDDILFKQIFKSSFVLESVRQPRMPRIAAAKPKKSKSSKTTFSPTKPSRTPAQSFSGKCASVNDNSCRLASCANRRQRRPQRSNSSSNSSWQCNSSSSGSEKRENDGSGRHRRVGCRPTVRMTGVRARLTVTTAMVAVAMIVGTTGAR